MMDATRRTLRSAQRCENFATGMVDQTSRNAGTETPRAISTAFGGLFYFLAVEQALLLMLFLFGGPRGHDSLSLWIHRGFGLAIAVFAAALFAAGRALRTGLPRPEIYLRRALLIACGWLVFYLFRATSRLTLDVVLAASRAILVGLVFVRVKRAQDERTNRLAFVFVLAHVAAYLVGYLTLRR